MEQEGQRKLLGRPDAGRRGVADAQPEVSSELNQPRWSVVSFDKREAGGLTYRQAANLVDVLDTHGTHGLCIITDEAAKRYNRKFRHNLQNFSFGILAILRAFRSVAYC